MRESQLSTLEDFPGWISLAKEVEPLFGPMVEDLSFLEGLRQAIAERDAFCIRQVNDDHEPTLHGGIIISREANEILWFAVAEKSRGRGIGKALLNEAVKHLDESRPMTVQTFAGSIVAGLPARKLYQRFGFEDSRQGDRNPAGIPTVFMVRTHG